MRARSILLPAAAGLVVACGAEPAEAPEPLPARWTAVRDRADGLAVRVPSAWHLARSSLTPGLSSPREVFSAGTFPLRHVDAPCAHLPAGALRRMGPRDVFVTVQESGGSTRGFPPRPRPFRLGQTASEISACLRRPVPFDDHWTAFRDGGRAFYVLTAVGRDAPASRRRDLHAVLDALRVDPARGERRMDPDESVPFDVNGISGLLPLGWHLEHRALTSAVGRRAQLAFGSFAVPRRPRDPNCSPTAALDALPPTGAFVFAFEYEDLGPAKVARFPPRPRRFRLGKPRAYECFGVSSMVRWREAGRALQAHVTLGPGAEEAQRRRVSAVLDNLRVRAR